MYQVFGSPQNFFKISFGQPNSPEKWHSTMFTKLEKYMTWNSYKSIPLSKSNFETTVYYNFFSSTLEKENLNHTSPYLFPYQLICRLKYIVEHIEDYFLQDLNRFPVSTISFETTFLFQFKLHFWNMIRTFYRIWMGSWYQKNTIFSNHFVCMY